MTKGDGQFEWNHAVLESRRAVYALLARLWSEPLDKETLATVMSPSWVPVFALVDEAASAGRSDDSELAAAYGRLAGAAEQLGIERLEAAYNWCFMGIGTKVAPWESVYVTGERLIMQPCTLAVREAYAAAGFAARNKGSEPDDHVATECDFVAKLAERAAAACAEGDDDVCCVALAQSRAFVEEHLGRRAADFAAEFDKAADKARACDRDRAEDARLFYGAVARFSTAFFDADICVVDALIAEFGLAAEGR